MLIRALGLEKKGGQLDNKINGIADKKRETEDVLKLRDKMRQKLQDLLDKNDNVPDEKRLPDNIVKLFKKAILKELLDRKNF